MGRRLPGLLVGLFLALLATGGTLPCPDAGNAAGTAVAEGMERGHPCGTDGHCATFIGGTGGIETDHGPVSSPFLVAAPSTAIRLPYTAPPLIRTARNEPSDGHLTYLQTLRLRL